VASPSPTLPSCYRCSSCHHQDLVNQHGQGPCRLLSPAGRKVQKRMENRCLVQKPWAAVAALSAARPGPVSLPVPTSAEDVAQSPCGCSFPHPSHPQHPHACHRCRRQQAGALPTLSRRPQVHCLPAVGAAGGGCEPAVPSQVQRSVIFSLAVEAAPQETEHRVNPGKGDFTSCEPLMECKAWVNLSPFLLSRASPGHVCAREAAVSETLSSRCSTAARNPSGTFALAAALHWLTG